MRYKSFFRGVTVAFILCNTSPISSSQKISLVNGQHLECSERLLFCELLNVDLNAHARGLSWGSNVFVRNVCGSYSLDNITRREYSVGYAALIVENTSSENIVLPDLRDPEWYIYRIDNGNRFAKSLSAISSRIGDRRLKLSPNQSVAYLFGGEDFSSINIYSNLCVCCESKSKVLYSNVLNRECDFFKCSRNGLTLKVVKLDKSQICGYPSSPLLISSDYCNHKSRILKINPNILPICGVVLLSNESSTNITVKGFSSDAWCITFLSKDLKWKRVISTEQLVPEKYQKDFILNPKQSKALAIGMPIFLHNSADILMRVEYQDGDIVKMCEGHFRNNEVLYFDTVE